MWRWPAHSRTPEHNDRRVRAEPGADSRTPRGGAVHAPARDNLVADESAEDFVGSAFRQLLPDLNGFRHFVVCKLTGGERENLCDIDTSSSGDHRVHTVAPFLVREPDNGGFYNALVPKQYVLNLARVHIEAA